MTRSLNVSDAAKRRFLRRLSKIGSDGDISYHKRDRLPRFEIGEDPHGVNVVLTHVRHIPHVGEQDHVIFNARVIRNHVEHITWNRYFFGDLRDSFPELTAAVRCLLRAEKTDGVR